MVALKLELIVSVDVSAWRGTIDAIRDRGGAERTRQGSFGRLRAGAPDPDPRTVIGQAIGGQREIRRGFRYNSSRRKSQSSS